MSWLTRDKNAWLGGNWGCWVQSMFPNWYICILVLFPAVWLFLCLQLSHWRLKIRPELARKNTARTGPVPITVPLQSSSGEAAEPKHLISPCFFFCLFVSISSLMEQIEPYPLEQGEGGFEEVFRSGPWHWQSAGWVKPTCSRRVGEESPASSLKQQQQQGLVAVWPSSHQHWWRFWEKKHKIWKQQRCRSS